MKLFCQIIWVNFLKSDIVHIIDAGVLITNRISNFRVIIDSNILITRLQLLYDKFFNFRFINSLNDLMTLHILHAYIT